MNTPRMNATKGCSFHKWFSWVSQSNHGWSDGAAGEGIGEGAALSRYGPRGEGDDCCRAVYRAAAWFLTDPRPLALRKHGGRYEQCGCVGLVW